MIHLNFQTEDSINQHEEQKDQLEIQLYKFGMS